MELTNLFTAIESIFTYYNDDEQSIYHFLRISSNPNVIDFDERIALVLYKTIIDGHLTSNDIETLYNENVSNYIQQINQYTGESDYNYIDRINSSEVLSRLRFCILDDEYFISTYNSKLSLNSTNDIKSSLRMNNYNGYGCHI